MPTLGSLFPNIAATRDADRGTECANDPKRQCRAPAMSRADRALNCRNPSSCADARSNNSSVQWDLSEKFPRVNLDIVSRDSGTCGTTARRSSFYIQDDHRFEFPGGKRCRPKSKQVVGTAKRPNESPAFPATTARLELSPSLPRHGRRALPRLEPVMQWR
jgi:hypothetical protein